MFARPPGQIRAFFQVSTFKKVSSQLAKKLQAQSFDWNFWRFMKFIKWSSYYVLAEPDFLFTFPLTAKQIKLDKILIKCSNVGQFNWRIAFEDTRMILSMVGRKTEIVQTFLLSNWNAFTNVQKYSVKKVASDWQWFQYFRLDRQLDCQLDRWLDRRLDLQLQINCNWPINSWNVDYQKSTVSVHDGNQTLVTRVTLWQPEWRHQQLVNGNRLSSSIKLANFNLLHLVLAIRRIRKNLPWITSRDP